MVSMLASCVVFSFTLMIIVSTATATLTDGLYTSNGTNILRVTESEVVSVHKSAGGRIVGLAYSHSGGYLFWSDISLVNRGIYRATADSSGRLTDVTAIVQDDVLEVNGLTVDWVSSHIYWTDERKRSVEVAEFDGTNRRILITERLSQPRGICADPVNGYLFWGDQGYHQIERSRLDGSERKIFVDNSSSIHWPNQMTVNNRKLYWVDAKHKTLDSVDVASGSSRAPVSLGGVAGSGHVYGLAFNDAGNAYISCWTSSASIIRVNGNAEVYKSGLSTGAVFSNVYISSGQQPSRSDPCASSGCVLCLPKSTTFRCSCPSYGGKVLKANQCVAPTNVLLYALADSGYVGFYDPTATDNGDLYFVARSLRPVAVAYDPVRKNVYWSDVRQRTIHRVGLDGSNPVILLDSSHGIGVVDGLAVDCVNRRLYYTNVGSMTVDQQVYSWHKVETIRLDSMSIKVRTIVSSCADRPRAIAVDCIAGYIYYTDWGQKASVVRTRLDGSNLTVLKTGLNNPNGIAVVVSKIYVTDSNYKTRTGARPAIDGSLYSMNLDGTGWTDVLAAATTKLKTPFGLTAVSAQKLYVSDWEKNAVFEVDVSVNPAAVTEVIRDVSLPMAVQYSVGLLCSCSPSSGSDPCSSTSCEECIRQSTSSSPLCTCNSYRNRRLNSNTCTVPSCYLLVIDMDGVKMVSLDSSNDRSVYVVAAGRPFASNLVALACDSSSNTAYYTDVRRKTIYVLLSNSTSTEFYRVNHIIDGLTVYNNQLYWTDTENGLIASLSINSSPLRHRVLVTGLDKPRAIVTYTDYLYWTEWGNSPRVARMRISSGSSSVQTVGPNTLKWPNALFVRGSHIYIADGHPTKRQLFKCSLPDVDNCQPVSQVNSQTVAHMYDIWVSSNNELLVYTDWKNRSINMLSLTTGTLLNPLAKGLMRPSQFCLVIPENIRGCSSSHGCSDNCFRLCESEHCVCNAGRTFNHSITNCGPLPDLSCSHGRNTYPVGSRGIRPTVCQQCQCLANTPYAPAGQLTCGAIQCPATDCPSPSVPRGQCCPRCADTCQEIEISNCPSSDVRKPLPATQNKVLYRFTPITRDCADQGRTITIDKQPPGDIYLWNGQTGHQITVTASATGGASDTCRFKIIPIDTTRPTIRCPADVRAYTTEVRWPSPQVSDNVGVESTRQSGSEFSVGINRVTYTVTDRAGLQSSCTFTVTVVRLAAGECVIPRLIRGNLVCAAANTVITCTTRCSTGYTVNPDGVGSSCTCQGGKWTPQIPEDFEERQCVRVIAGRAQGSISVTLNNVCNSVSGRLQTSYTKEVLEYRVEVDYLPYSLFELDGEVLVSGCGGGRRRRRDANEVIITVTISGNYATGNERPSIRQDIEYILKRIQEDLLKGFLIVPLRDDNGIWTAAIVNPRDNVTIDDTGCPQGSYRHTGGCILCPAGTHLSGSECVNCEEGTYNDKDGQETCTDCPDDKTSPEGAYNVDQCTAGSGGIETWLIIVIVVVIVVIIIIIVVVVVIVVCCIKKRRKNQQNGRHGDSHNNPAFEPTYDTIDNGNEGNGYEAIEKKGNDPQYSTLSDE